jgi:AraC-like DNA-binding protein
MSEPAFQRSASVLASWVAAIARALSGKGLDAHDLLRQVGIDPAALRDPDERLSATQLHALWTLAMSASQDPLIGLEAARSVSPNTFQSLGYALLASGSLRELLDGLVRYSRMLADHVEVRLTEDGPHLHVDLLPTANPLHTAALDAAMCVLFHACKRVSDDTCQVVALRLQRPAPADMPRFQRFFAGATLVFGDALNRLTLDRHDTHRPSRWGNAELVQANAAVVERYLARVSRDDICNRVRLVLVELLPRGEPPPQEVANALHLSVRSLQRHLADAGTTYRDLLAETRREQACLLLRARHLSVSEVAHTIGFAEVSSFTRAFRRWMGCAPSEWRAQSR